ncbi:MAG: protein translocase subunit SecF [Sporichthyaceae bacterium]
MSRLAELGADLQSGRRSYNFIGRGRMFAWISLALIALSVLSLGVRQLDLGVEFDGGSVFEAQSQSSIDVESVREAVEAAGAEDPRVQTLGDNRVRVETATVTADDATKVATALAENLSVTAEDVTTQLVGPTWGDDVTNKALQSLVIFLIGVSIYLAVVFEPKMALGALAALLHDLVVTIGIYALVGFTVTPATVIGLLTILGYSLYDTVVVFDKIKENTADLVKTNRMSYSAATNLAVNQTLARSINTTVIALLPVGGLLFVGAGLLGAGTLKDLALVLFVGLAIGAYSSVCLAPPITAALKEREPAMKEVAKRAAARQAGRKDHASGEGAAPGGGVVVTAPVAPGERSQPKRGGTRSQRSKKRL